MYIWYRLFVYDFKVNKNYDLFLPKIMSHLFDFATHFDKTLVMGWEICIYIKKGTEK